MITTFYSYIVYLAIAMGGYWFMGKFSPLDGPLLVCDFTVATPADYSAAGPLLSTITDYDSCMAVIKQAWEIEDLDNNGLVTRCEDANFQVHFGGSTEAYATKFSGQYTLGAAY